MDEARLTWGSAQRNLPERWPKDESGAPEAPALLAHRMERNYEVELLERLLGAYDVPVLISHGNYGSLGKVVVGFSGEGVDLFVPASMLEDARNLLQPVDGADLDVEASECETI